MTALIQREYEDLISAAASGDTNRVVLLELPADTSKWIQLTWDAFNAAFPLDESPLECLARLGVSVPPGFSLVGCEAGTYVTFEHGSPPAPLITDFTRSYSNAVLGCPVDHLRLRHQML